MTDLISLTHARAWMNAQGVGTLCIQTDNHLNILGTPVTKDVTLALETLARREDLRVLVLRGSG